ncbi:MULTISPECIES: DeoR/GlpR family DNA-binding transcription regulator [Bacillus]|uniref:DeoR/GlpR family DNA-binding transcription regulator n=1 Tax=Bacillus TaxID=1386 RepID=UPI0001A1496B|nr:DeoR/GlpR family DNA-binding transcription regulator [Bacillus pseudomycoides]EEM18810.1 DeoR-family transcriptional regulator (Transcriptional regulator, DeoR family) [Bacillus pseudomycoides DSM 12442]MED1598481.1 DeoR/GlpR family DNA-binding transcription regulator [Bacillus pseudomycoides]MED4712771.1 DeoR/GlpR family DNA-binding transcription regulator [Bacillus pseudomycoides]OOR51943.1 DeoR family transcriptional regulator [Bacillus pseudomycoides]PDY11929.1 DeoR/GlpR transcriptional
MSNSPVERRNKIIEILEQREHVEVSYLSDAFQVSLMTIRRDLEKLEKDGKVIRMYGGVKLKTKRVYEYSMEERLNSNKREKLAIAREAARLIEDGDVVAFDASTTALEVSKLIKDRKDVTVVTNNLSIAIELADVPEIVVIVLGGFLRGKSLSVMGASLKQYLETIYIDKAFISSKALSFHEGLTDTAIDEGEAKQAMLSKSSEVIVLADHTKLGNVAFYKVCDKQGITKIITDELIPLTPLQQECINSYKEYGTPIILAN